MRKKTKWILIATTTPVMLALLVLLCPLGYGVWLPDIWTGQWRTLGTLTLTNGITFRVIQHWNYSDFYTTALIQTNPDGTECWDSLDLDDIARWSVALSPNWFTKCVTVDYGDDCRSRIYWEKKMPTDRGPW